MAASSAPGLAAQRRTIMLGMAVAAPVAVLVWEGTYRLLPAEMAARGAADPVRFAFGCVCLALLLCLVSGVEAIAHRRLFSAAIDPLAGADPPAMKVDQRYLQQTLEQILVFAGGLFGLAFFAPPAVAARAIAATTLVWIVARFVFWIGYHRGARFRAPGLVGMVQSILVLLWVVWRFGTWLGGPALGAAPLLLFAAIEAVLVYRARR
jgi:hypothetical protein